MCVVLLCSCTTTRLDPVSVIVPAHAADSHVTETRTRPAETRAALRTLIRGTRGVAAVVDERLWLLVLLLALGTSEVAPLPDAVEAELPAAALECVVVVVVVGAA